MSKNFKFIINMITAIISLLINYGINFFFTPYLVEIAGGEAFGFVNLATNMVNYASIVTIAISSVSGRYITIKVHQNLKDDAKRYFNSVLYANIFLAVILCVISLPIVYYLENIISIPTKLIGDVKLLFVFVVINFCITLVSNVYTVATFITNKLYLSSIGNCINSIIRVGLLWLLFGLFPANVAYMGLTALICAVFLSVYNFEVTKKLVPIFKINRSYYSFGIIKELVCAGIWSSITKLSQVLSDGLDLLISNIGVSAYAMGQLSIAYVLPNIIKMVLSTICSLFQPQQTYYYAKSDIPSVIKELKFGMKFSGFFVSIIFAGFITMGYDFFSLWVPGQNTSMINNLAILSIISVLAAGVATPLDNVFLLTNNLRINSLVWLIASVLDTLIVLFMVKYTSIGVYAVAGVSKITAAILYLSYTPIYASKCLKVSKKTFYPLIFRYLLNNVVLIFLFKVIYMLLPMAHTWGAFIVKCILCGIVGAINNYLIFLSKEEQGKLKQMCMSKIIK